jgi:hypothetical protein
MSISLLDHSTRLHSRRRLRLATRLLLAGALADNTLGVSTAGAQAVSRVIPRVGLPGDFQHQLPRGEVTRVSTAGVDTVAATASEVVIRPGEVLAVRTGDTAVVVPRLPGGGPLPAGMDSALGLPFTYLGLDRGAAAPTVYRPLFLPAGPLRYRPERDYFVGSFLLGLQDSAHPTTIRELSAPVRMRFAGDPDSITPDSVVLRQTNAQMERIQVLARVAFDSVRVMIVPAFDPGGVGVWLPIQPALRFEQAPKSIQGLGVGGATLVVSRWGTKSRDSVPVTLSITQGSLEMNQLYIAEAGGVVRIRSEGLGQATIGATAAGLAPAQITVAYTWPIAFVAAALLGGLLGGFVAHLYARRRSAVSPGRNLLKGVLVGLLTCLVYFGLGINLLQFNVDVRFFNELAVFGLAALAGAFGIPALSGAAR